LRRDVRGDEVLRRLLPRRPLPRLVLVLLYRCTRMALVVMVMVLVLVLLVL
jgi:hypothetical protein